MASFKFFTASPARFREVKSVAGCIGPCPVPEEVSPGWVRSHFRSPHDIDDVNRDDEDEESSSYRIPAHHAPIRKCIWIMGKADG